MAELERTEPDSDTPDVDLRSYSEDTTTFYEVGESEAWIEVSDGALVDEGEWR